MAEKENGEEPQVNLEMPSIGFGRKKRRKESGPAEEPADEATEQVAAVPAEPAARATEPSIEETRPLYVDDLPPAVPPTEAPIPEVAPEAATEATRPAAEVEPEPEAGPEPAPREPRAPIITGMAAALVTGAVVGGLTVGMTYLGLLGCESLQGTSSCGGPGFFILVAIMVLMVVAGSWLLKFFQVVDPGSTSFLAVGLAVVIALLFFVDYLDEAWMAIVMPVIVVATYALAHWVTVRYIEPADHG